MATCMGWSEAHDAQLASAVSESVGISAGGGSVASALDGAASALNIHGLRRGLSSFAATRLILFQIPRHADYDDAIVTTFNQCAAEAGGFSRVQQPFPPFHLDDSGITTATARPGVLLFEPVDLREQRPNEASIRRLLDDQFWFGHAMLPGRLFHFSRPIAA